MNRPPREWVTLIRIYEEVRALSYEASLSATHPAAPGGPMGEFKLHVGLKVVGWLATLVIAAAIGLFVTS